MICPPGLSERIFPATIRDGAIEAIVTDQNSERFNASTPIIRSSADIQPGERARSLRQDTEWLLFTSGTTGEPKMVAHSLLGLTGAIKNAPEMSHPSAWATFYDMRRYGGLQIFLRAVLGGCSFVMSSTEEPLSDYLERLAEHNVSRISGTPSHWRRVLMNPNASMIRPSYVRLSGEIADQAVLDGLRALYPDAQIVHAFASTEAGVGFEVHDTLEGFPASFLGEREDGVTIAVKNGSLHLKSNRAALGYVSAPRRAVSDEQGFVDTGDLVELRGNRYHFVGRRDGVINVGGQKVHPEEVEAVINRHSGVRMSLVRPQKSAILGALVVADVVAQDSALQGSGSTTEALRHEIRDICIRNLDRHKVPAIIRFVPSLEMTASGKVARHHA